jgi:hypothetical protein
LETLDGGGGRRRALDFSRARCDEEEEVALSMDAGALW